MTAFESFAVPWLIGVHGAQSATATFPALPIAPTWMCAAVAAPERPENDSVHVSLLPCSVPWKVPLPLGACTACAGTSCIASSFADQPMLFGAARATAVTT